MRVRRSPYLSLLIFYAILAGAGCDLDNRLAAVQDEHITSIEDIVPEDDVVITIWAYPAPPLP